MFRVRTGTLAVNNVVSHMDPHQGKQCPSCGADVETTDHFLFVCKALSALRDRVYAHVGGFPLGTAPDALSRELREELYSAGFGEPARMAWDDSSERLRFERERSTLLHQMWMLRCRGSMTRDRKPSTGATPIVHADTV